MPSKAKAKSRPAKSPPPLEDPTIKKYKLFASSKSAPGVKIKKPVRDERRGSDDSQRITNSQFSVVISESESDNDDQNGAKVEDDAIKSDSAGPSGNGEMRSRSIIRDDGDDDEMAVSEASSMRNLTSGNTAKCSRGRKSSKMQPTNGHIQRVSAFKPLQKSKTSDASNKKEVKQGTNFGKGKEREQSITGQDDDDDDKQAELLPKKNKEMFRGSSDSSESEEFHELPDPLGAESAIKESNQKNNEMEKEQDINNLNQRKKRKASAEDVDSALGVVATASAVSNSRDGKLDLTQYTTREEFEKEMTNLKEQMEAEMIKVKTQIRLETKRLIRNEVKDEILLAQQS